MTAHDQRRRRRTRDQVVVGRPSENRLHTRTAAQIPHFHGAVERAGDHTAGVAEESGSHHLARMAGQRVAKTMVTERPDAGRKVTRGSDQKGGLKRYGKILPHNRRILRLEEHFYNCTFSEVFIQL